MVKSELRKIASYGFKKTKHTGNIATTNLETAIYWAGQRASENDPGLVISFLAPKDVVKQDDIHTEDYRFIKKFTPIDVQIIYDDILDVIHF